MSFDCRSSHVLSRKLLPEGRGQGARPRFGSRVDWQSTLLGLCTHVALPVLILGCPAAAAAEADLYVSLRYDANTSAKSCWDEPEFRKNVTQRVGYDPFREDAPITISIRLGRPARSLIGQVEWRNSNGAALGERRFIAEDGNCTRLLAEMSFAVALQIQLLRTEEPPATVGVPPTAASAGASNSAAQKLAPSAAAPVASTEQRPSTQSSIPVATESPPKQGATAPEPSPAAQDDQRPQHKGTAVAPVSIAPASARWSMWLGVGPSLALGMAPSATSNLRVFGAARRNQLSVEVGADANYPSTERKWDNTGFREQLIGVTTAFCVHPGALSACLLGKASQVRVAGLGVDQSRTPSGFIAHAGLRLAASLGLGGPWFTTGRFDALALLTPCTVDLNRVSVWEIPRFGALAGFDVAARFR